MNSMLSTLASVRLNEPAPTKYMMPSRYTAVSATSAIGGMPRNVALSANVPPMKPMSCSAYTIVPKKP